MDVDSFISAHRGEWERLETLVRGGASGLAARGGAEISEAVRLYQRVSTQLTEARSRYADPALARYLNDLVGRARQAVYSATPRTAAGLVTFFGARYRAQIRRTAPYILVMAALMVVVVLASWLWVARSQEARFGLIPEAARATIQRLGGARRPDLGPSPALATEIFFNNMQVAFFAFALGITLGIGTVYVVVNNALMLGVLAGAFGAAGHAGAFWALILPHGILELTAICIAAGAGLRIGWAIVDPGERSRSRALADEATEAVIVVVGVIPAFLLAALIEGFITGSVPAFVEVTIGVVVGAAYVAFLFGVRRPRRDRRAAPATGEPAQSLPADLIAR